MTYLLLYLVLAVLAGLFMLGAAKVSARSGHYMEDTLLELPESEWPDPSEHGCLRGWSSRNFMVQLFEEEEPGVERLTVHRTEKRNGRWYGHITHDELEAVRNACGFTDRWAVEVFPPSPLGEGSHVRHLWLYQRRPQVAESWQSLHEQAA
ncbi:hypothetical protein C7446_1577 [Kushneria sinocarnis]|uniref:DUF7694 domain-containing protein n=1 Tax=Kushneria sinocarnis TaxID=595502 RepID=A0A420WXB3_9GAMM|nr:hypothetical protein [Kushneria sinocarnis]RKR04370.1 hypothetical protein C7446_1577 [Kushneria sinocarnis]